MGFLPPSSSSSSSLPLLFLRSSSPFLLCSLFSSSFHFSSFFLSSSSSPSPRPLLSLLFFPGPDSCFPGPDSCFLPSSPRNTRSRACKDFHACTWPEGLSNGDISLAQYFDSMNEKNHDLVEEIQRTCHTVVTFSHFVPRQELCPEKRMLFYPELPKIIGSDPLEARIRSIHGKGRSPSACHVFGHTHFCWDSTIAGIRYIQAPLAYPRERRRRMNGGEDWLPFCLFRDGEFSDRLSPCFWSDYYAQNSREPENTRLAPWVARRFYRKKS